MGCLDEKRLAALGWKATCDAGTNGCGRIVSAFVAGEFHAGRICRGSGQSGHTRQFDGIARRIAAHPPEAIRMTRRLLRQAWNNSLPAVLEMSAAMQAIAHHTEDYSSALARVISATGRRT